MINFFVLGCHSPYPGVDGATSGYLISTNKTKILIDCGSGVLAQLSKHVKIENLDAIIISHTHADHVSDLDVFKYAIHQNIQTGKRNKPLYFYGPHELAEDFKKFEYKETFLYKPITVETNLVFGNINLSFCHGKHKTISYAIKVVGNNKTIIYTSDSEYCSDLLEFATNVDLLVCEASLDAEVCTKDTGHMNAIEAGELANEVLAKQLLLTHYHPERDKISLVTEARKRFTGPITVAEKGQLYYII